MTDPESTNTLSALCHRVGALRRYLIKQRASLPTPGYHLDITPEDAEKTRKLLAELPNHCRWLLSGLRDFQAETNSAHFSGACACLEKLADDPRLLFRAPALEIYQGLETNTELLTSIGIDPALLTEKEPSLC